MCICRSPAWHVFLPTEEGQQSRTNSSVSTFVRKGPLYDAREGGCKEENYSCSVEMKVGSLVGNTTGGCGAGLVHVTGVLDQVC